MGNCTIKAPAGANGNCISYLSEAVGALILPAGTSFDHSELDNLEKIRPYLNEDLDGYVLEFNGSEPADAEVVTETTGFGDNFISGEGSPSLVAYAKTNVCDFREMLQSLKSDGWGTFFILADGSILGTVKGDGNVYGFNSQIWAHRLGIPGRENKSQQYKVSFNFGKADEFDNPYVADVAWTINELQMLLPVGLTALVATPFNAASNEMYVSINYRCSSSYPDTGASLEAQVVKTNISDVLDPIVVTWVDENVWSVTITKNSSTSLVTGDYVEFILIVKNGSVIEEASNEVKAQA